MYFRLMAAIADLPVTSTSESIHNSLTVLLDLDNVSVAVEIPLRQLFKIRYLSYINYVCGITSAILISS
jgi:hypothetical protein